MLKLASFAQWSLLHLVSELLLMYFILVFVVRGTVYQNLLVAIFSFFLTDLLIWQILQTAQFLLKLTNLFYTS